jgi:hypothetical protein
MIRESELVKVIKDGEKSPATSHRRANGRRRRDDD